MGIKEEINSRINAFRDICNANKVKKLYAFGSSVTDHFDTQRSDIDLLVELDIADPLERGEALMNLWDNLENLFGKKIDLLTNASIRNPILRNSIERTKVLIYDGERKEVLI